jgi:LysR family transcriptional activator of dmlA
VDNRIDNEDLRVFAIAARKASFAAAAEELGMSPAYVSKRIGILEQMLGVRLFHRTTRRVTVSEDGERVYAHAMTILENLDSLLHEVAERREVPRGLLRISSSFGFGRNVVAPVVARLVAEHPSLQVRFEVFDRLVDIVTEGFDLDIRIGDEIAPHLIARKLMANHRILCAAPAYLKQHGTPRNLRDLASHNCLSIKERDLPFGVWSLQHGGTEEMVKVTGSLSSNHGEIALQWAVAGAGIVLRSHWDAQPHLTNGELVQVLPQYTQSANVWAVYPQRLADSAKVRICVEFMQQQLSARLCAAAFNR